MALFFQARDGLPNNVANLCGPQFQYIPGASHALERDPDAAGPYSEGSQVTLVTGLSCCEYH